MKRTPLLTATLSLLAFVLPSCDTMDKVFEPQPKGNAADPLAVLPPDFLFTRYAPLNNWLDTPVRVQIMDTPLMDVFRHPALRGLEYVVVKAPPTNPKISIDKLALTRRQLLWSLSHDHQLHMTPSYNAAGEISCIEIRSRSVDLPN